MSSTALEAGPAPGGPEDLHVFAARYGSAEPLPVSFEWGEEGLIVRTQAFTAVIGDPAGDAHAEPELTLSAVV